MTVTPQTNASLEEIAQVIAQYESFAICGHVNPDGDCIGSQLGLAEALKSLGKDTVCLFAEEDQGDRVLSFLPGYDEMMPARAYSGAPDVFIGVDVPSRERVGDGAPVRDRAKVAITIDHHAFDTAMSDFVHVDPAAASTSLLVWEMIPYLVAEPSYEMALCCYTGLVSDTGGFAYQNTDERAFIAAAEMVGHGAQPNYVALKLFQNRSAAELKLEARSLAHMCFIADGDAVFSWVSADDIRDAGAEPADFANLIDTLRSMRDIRVACILRDQGDCVRGSIRAKDETDVAAIARSFGGGGHTAAAGFTMYVPLEEAKAQVVSAIGQALGKRS